ncbi:MAG: maleylacetoacetate isomerase [Myxococcota bacterium]
MEGLRLYSYWRSSCAWRVRLGLAVKSQSYEYVAVNLREGAQLGDAYASVNPQHQVPTLEWTVDGDVQRLTQSLAILRFVDSLPGPSLVPADALDAARVTQAAETISAGIQPLQNLFVLKAIDALGGDRVAWARDAIRRGFLALEALASQTAGTFVVGDSLSLADLCLIPQMYNARRFKMDLSSFPTLVRVDAHCAELPAFKEAHAHNQPDADLEAI